MEDKNLQIQLKADLTSEWNKLLDQHECLRNSPVIYPHHKELSLIQEHNLLKSSIESLFSRPERLISESLKYRMCIDVTNVENIGVDAISMHHINEPAQQTSRFVVNIASDQFNIIEFNQKSEFVQVCKMELKSINEKFEKYGQLKLCHAQFYNEQTVSLLLTDAMATNFFVQFPMSCVKFRMSSYKFNQSIDLKTATVLNFFDIVDPMLVRALEFADGLHIAVSGSRKMASILAPKTRRIRHYEMEVEDEDDDVDLSQINNSLNISKESTA